MDAAEPLLGPIGGASLRASLRLFAMGLAGELGGGPGGELGGGPGGGLGGRSAGGPGGGLGGGPRLTTAGARGAELGGGRYDEGGGGSDIGRLAEAGDEKLRVGLRGTGVRCW